MERRWQLSLRMGLPAGLLLATVLVVAAKPGIAAGVYNLPIMVLFPIFAAELILSLLAAFRNRVWTEWVWFVVFLTGFGVLVSRLILHQPFFSGHMVWFPILIARAWLSNAPRLLRYTLLTVAALNLYDKFFVAEDWGAGLRGLGLGLLLPGFAIGLQQALQHGKGKVRTTAHTSETP